MVWGSGDAGSDHVVSGGVGERGVRFKMHS